MITIAYFLQSVGHWFLRHGRVDAAGTHPIVLYLLNQLLAGVAQTLCGWKQRKLPIEIKRRTHLTAYTTTCTINYDILFSLAQDLCGNWVVEQSQARQEFLRL